MGYFAAAAMTDQGQNPTPQQQPQHHRDVIERLLDANVDELTPRQALDLLYALKSTAGGENP